MLFKSSTTTTIFTVLGVLFVTIISNTNPVQAFSPGLSPSMSKTTTLAAPLPLAVMKQSSTFSSSSMPSSSNTALQAAKKGQDGATEKTKKNKPIFNGSTIVGLACAFAVFDYVYLHLIFNRL